MLMESFSEVIGIANAVIDVDGIVIVESGWQKACTEFHRTNAESCRRCIESDTLLAERVTGGALLATYRCHNGLLDSAAPIIVEGRHLANVLTGQFLTSPPDLEFFRKQAKQFGFDAAGYLEAIAKVPVLSQARVESVARLYAQLAGLLATNSLDRLRERKTAETLAGLNKLLEEQVALRTQSLARANEDLAGREALLKQILDTSSVAIFLLDTEGRITQANQRMADMFGRSLDALVGIEYVALVHPTEREIGRQNMLALLARAIPSVELDRLYRRTDQTEFWGHLTCNRFCDANGDEHGLIGVIADITDRKHDELAQVHKIIEAAPDPMLLVDNDGNIAFANFASQSVFGYALSELIGQNVDSLVPIGRRSNHAQWRSNFQGEGGRSVSPSTGMGTLTAVRKDGTEFPVEIRLSRLQIDHRPVVIASLNDISERRQAADLLQQSFAEMRRLVDHRQSIREHERKRMAQDIHDDLGQNLLALKMDVVTLCKSIEDLNSTQNKLAQVVLNNIDATIKSVKEIINDLRPTVLELGLHPAVEWQLKQFERTSGIASSLVASPPHVNFGLDERRTLAVFRIMQESLTNVARHARATEVEITLNQHDSGFSMEVKDNGKGLQSDDRRKKNSFGLMGIKERVDSLGGELIITSGPGKGTVLSIFIPQGEDQ